MLTVHDKSFPLGVVLTVLSGKLLCDLDALYEVLKHLTGEQIFTHQIPRALCTSRHFVAQQHPDLAVLDWSEINTDNCRNWLAEQITMFGAERSLAPLPPDAYEATDPFDELLEMREQRS